MTESADGLAPSDRADIGPPAAPLTLRDGLPKVVATQRELAESTAALRAGGGPVAVDAERASGYRYSQRAYLIQLRRAGAATVLIDPVPFGDVPNDALAPLGAALADQEWVLHAASQDLAGLAEVGLVPTRLFDTELAGRLLNYPRVGLAVLVEELLGYSMRKEHSAVDWSRRPLPESWLRYAALDVELLVELRDRLAEQLDAAGKSEWARQEFAARVEAALPGPRTDPWRRTAGIHRVRGRRGLAIVRAMWRTRDDLARSRDLAPSKVLRDDALVQAAQAAPASRPALLRLAGFANRSGQRYAKEFLSAVRSALALTDAELPTVAMPLDGPPPARAWAAKHPAAAARLVACRTVVSELAVELDLPQENLLSPDAVRRLAWPPPQSRSGDEVAQALASFGARRWQVELTAGPLAEALAGLD
ncbi:MAG: HRDC domain-containing protein [Nocardioidaceae bacterium]